MDIGQHGICFGNTDCVISFVSVVFGSLAVKVFTLVFCKITQI